MRLIGIDPGLAALGIASVELLPATERVLAIEVIRTEPCDKKRNLRVMDDMGDRLRNLAHALLHYMGPDVVAICVESKAIPFRNGRMCVKPSAISALGRVRGLIDYAAAQLDLPVIEETAQALKMLTTGSKTATKEQVCEAVEARWPEVSGMWPPQSGLREHAGDALAAVVAGLSSDVVRAARRARGAA